MKPTNQVRKNGSTATAPSQAKTSRDHKPANPDPFAPPSNENEPSSCICIYDRQARKPVQLVPLTGEELAATLAQCLKPESPQKTSGEVVADAILKNLRGDKIGECLAEIEEAKNEVIHIFQFIEAGDLDPMVDRLTDRLASSVDKGFRALRGELFVQ